MSFTSFNSVLLILILE
ncbi:hypothetical protein FWK35_00011126 [Aphis craccivora]|nr:hypothetical protein FWK35_00033991 [Aphis craccivora]KAF0714417.1 hypothetical protein FWK35_00031584 [Aphis craccivora]KAF0759374.1 hypothetical protein FWK35_00010074 [Aphis craccivora]KAF0764296.1 hypothetical protein FWK35_00012064 [Aphis craccivora]KAF0773393.1 hypothetical protein FWK35_00011126 [Aphis craccivora]